jgi:hypothetical protein
MVMKVAPLWCGRKRMPKKVLILDVDGVIYNWDKIARIWHKK